MKLIFVRHGQTNYNIKGLCNDSAKIDVHLTHTGIQQAKQIAEKLKGIKIDMVYTSHIPRTHQTAKYINKYHNVKTIIDKRIGDLITGFEGETVKEYVKNLEYSKDLFNTKFNNGETLTQFKQRIFDFINEIKQLKYNTILVVSHQGVLKFIKGYFENLTDNQIYNLPSIPNCETLEYEI